MLEYTQGLSRAPKCSLPSGTHAAADLQHMPHALSLLVAELPVALLVRPSLLRADGTGPNRPKGCFHVACCAHCCMLHVVCLCVAC